MVFRTRADLPPPTKRVQNTKNVNFGKSGPQANGKFPGEAPYSRGTAISLISKKRALHLESGHLCLLGLALAGFVIIHLFIFLSLSFLICQMEFRGISPSQYCGELLR